MAGNRNSYKKRKFKNNRKSKINGGMPIELECGNSEVIEMFTLTQHTRAITCVAFHQELPFMATGSIDTSVSLHYMPSPIISNHRKAVIKYDSAIWYNSAVLCIAFHPYEALLAVGYKDATVKLYSFSPYSEDLSPKYVATVKPKAGPVYSVAFQRCSRLLLTMSKSEEQNKEVIKLWQIGNSKDISYVNIKKIIDKDVGQSVAFHQRYDFMFNSHNMNANLWVIGSPERTPTNYASIRHSNLVRSVAIHAILPYIATGCENGTATLWKFTPDGSAPHFLANMSGLTNWTTCLAFHPIEPLLAMGGIGDAGVKLWTFSPDGYPTTCVATLNMGYATTLSIAFHPTANILAIASNNSVTLWNLIHILGQTIREPVWESLAMWTSQQWVNAETTKNPDGSYPDFSMRYADLVENKTMEISINADSIFNMADEICSGALSLEKITRYLKDIESKKEKAFTIYIEILSNTDLIKEKLNYTPAELKGKYAKDIAKMHKSEIEKQFNRVKDFIKSKYPDVISR